MKWLIVFMMMPLFLFGQEQTDNVLIITKEGTDKMTLMGEVLDVLDSKSMSVETADKDFGRIKTDIITTTIFWGSWDNRYSFKVSDGVCEMRGEFNITGIRDKWEFANYKGAKKSVPIITWNVMKEIAADVGGEVSYKTK